MNLEQITFRVDIDCPGSNAAFVHFVQEVQGSFVVKIGDLIMSVDEFSDFVTQLNQIKAKLKRIDAFAGELDE